MENQTPDKYRKIPHQSFCDLSRKDKIQYVLDYYLQHILGAAVLLVIILTIVIYFAFQYRRTQLYAICADVSTEQTEQLIKDFVAYADINTRKYTVVWDDVGYNLGGQDDYNVLTKIFTLVGAGQADILIYGDADADSFLKLAIAADLESTLPDTLYERWVADGLVQTGVILIDEEDESLSTPYAFALDITDTAFVAQYGLHPVQGERIYLSISANPKNEESAVQFVQFICGEQPPA